MGWKKVVIAAFALLLAAAPSWASSVYVWAESAQFPAGSTGCSRVSDSGTNFADTVVLCTDGPNRKFTMKAVFPPGNTTTWDGALFYRVSSSGSLTCAWDVWITAHTLTQGHTVNTKGTSGEFLGPTGSHTGGYQYFASTADPVPVYNNVAADDCSTTPGQCDSAEVSILVQLNETDTTSDNCEFVYGWFFNYP